MTTKITGDNISSIANTGVTWNAVTVADGSTILNASAGNGYFLDTNTGVIEVNLPSSPSRGDTVILVDYGGNFATNNVRVRSGSNIIDSVEQEGSGIGYVLSTNNLIVELVYVDSTKGWLSKENESKSDLTAADDTNAKFIVATGGTVTTSGNFKIHSFTGDGNFIVTDGGNSIGANTVDYVVVAGGGAGGCGGPGDNGGGGGAGGYRESSGAASGCYTISPLGACVAALPVPAATYPVTVGGGGAVSPKQGGAGSNSVFSTITSTGGGGGAANAAGPGYSSPDNGNGGSGGGARGGGGIPGVGGNGNTPPVSPPQGKNGGAGGSGIGPNPQSPDGGAGGGGGATQAGSNAQDGPGGAGGAGATNHITGSPVVRAGGGGGGAIPGNTRGSGGSGGGGAGGNDSCGSADGTANTGGGGGGANPCSPTNSGAGGKGVVIIRYKFQ